MKTSTLRKIAFVAMISLTLALIGCRSAPVYNATDVPVNASEKATAADVKKAIMLAGAAFGWQMKEVEPGHIVATLALRKHMAIVDIPYSTDSFSILYKDSTELGYNGSSIHNNYNGWVQNLERQIMARLSVL
jgi:hypothetical protein